MNQQELNRKKKKILSTARIYLAVRKVMFYVVLPLFMVAHIQSSSVMFRKKFQEKAIYLHVGELPFAKVLAFF